MTEIFICTNTIFTLTSALESMILARYYKKVERVSDDGLLNGHDMMCITREKQEEDDDKLGLHYHQLSTRTELSGR